MTENIYTLRGLRAKIHIAKKQLGMDDPTYRAVLLRAAGKESCAVMTAAQLEVALKEFERLGFQKQRPARAGRAKPASGVMARKIRALWLSLWNLGEVDDPSEATLEAFIRRTTTCQKLQWITPAQADKVIRALYGWLERTGWVKPAERDAWHWRRALIDAQLERLDITFDAWLQAETNGHAAPFDPYDADGLDGVIARLGAQIRKAKP